MKNPLALPEDTGPLIVVRGQKLRPVTPKDVAKYEQYEMDFRFVREVEYLEREGRVPSRRALEKALRMERGAIAAIRLGVRGVNMYQYKKLHQLYRGDRDFILYGVRNKELNNPFIPGIGRLDKYEPYVTRYTSPARWKVGPRPESQSEYYPSDPNNELWTAPPIKGPARKNAKKKEEGED
ncbi:MAG: hypothetical protein NVS3B25_18880 [Hymenobacter sp.]